MRRDGITGRPLIIKPYLKKFGLISLKIIPDDPNKAIPITTFLISPFPLSASFESPPEAAINTPPARIATKLIKRIIVTSILVNPPISFGKALVSVTSVSLVDVVFPKVIHCPINGTLVLRSTPSQQTRSFCPSG